MRNFEELRRQLLDRLDTGRELEEAEIREAIDNLVLEEGRTCLLSLKEKPNCGTPCFIPSGDWTYCRNWRRILR